MSGVNKAIIVGRLGRDPELRYLQNGTPVCKLNIATSKKYTNNNHETVEKTEWHRVTVWGKLAEVANNYLTKGKEVYIEGELKTSEYMKEGQKHWVTEIHCTSLHLIGGGTNSGNSEEKNQKQNSDSKPKSNSKQNNQDNPVSDSPEPSFSEFNGNPGDDDIPF